MATNSLRARPSTKTGVASRTKFVTVMAWSVTLFWRTAASTPMKMATKMAMTVAMMTMRSVTKRWDIACEATSWPLMVVPRFPWMAPVNQIQ